MVGAARGRPKRSTAKLDRARFRPRYQRVAGSIQTRESGSRNRILAMRTKLGKEFWAVLSGPGATQKRNSLDPDFDFDFDFDFDNDLTDRRSLPGGDA